MKRQLVILGGLSAVALGGALVAAQPAEAKVPGPNGQIVFDRSGAAGDTVAASNPDGSGLRTVHAGPGCCARWSPSGELIAMAAETADGRIGTAVVNPDGSGYHLLPLPAAGLNANCDVWSPSSTRLACEGWDDGDPSRAGLYSVQSSDGGDVVRLTVNPYGGHDIPGDYSPDGTRIAFVRENPTRHDGQAAVFAARSDGTQPRQITPWGKARVSASWSPDGTWILFDAGGRLYVVRPDGSRMTQVRLRAPDSRYYALEPGWSPDGTRIVFAMFLPSLPDNDIFTARADGSDVVNVTNSPDQHEGQPDWGSHQDPGIVG